MSNPLYQQQFGSNPQNQQNQFGNPTNMVQRFQEFRRNFSGNPQEIIQQMMNSGKISQEQYNQAVQTANRIMKMMK